MGHVGHVGHSHVWTHAHWRHHGVHIHHITELLHTASKVHLVHHIVVEHTGVGWSSVGSQHVLSYIQEGKCVEESLVHVSRLKDLQHLFSDVPWDLGSVTHSDHWLQIACTIVELEMVEF